MLKTPSIFHDWEKRFQFKKRLLITPSTMKKSINRFSRALFYNFEKSVENTKKHYQ